jgi:GDP-L-fucose synthase
MKNLLVTGAKGLLGSELTNIERDCWVDDRNFYDWRKSDSYGLRPKTIIHCAAKVGGVQANTAEVQTFFEENMQININIMRLAYKSQAKLVSILSTCIYPDAPYVKYPLTEDQLHMGPPHSSNYGYAYAKRMLEVQTRAYRQQHGCNFISVIPNNLYGPNDNYDLENGHVIPALIRKFHEAKLFDHDHVEIWGSGNPLREFTYARDAAQIILWLAENYDGGEPVNIGNTDQVSIRSLAQIIAEETGYVGEIRFNTAKPDGQYEKPSSNQLLKSLGWQGDYTPLRDGLKETIKIFQSRYPKVRGVKI